MKQKISGRIRTRDGAEHFRVVRSCPDTLRKQGHNLRAMLRQAVAGPPVQSAAEGPASRNATIRT